MTSLPPTPPRIVWLTGLSASGKSTIAGGLRARLIEGGVPVAVIDGDVLRTGLCADLGFTDADRTENIRRASHVAGLMADAGLVVIAALISPKASDRDEARRIAGSHRFVEVFVDAPIGVCIDRDPKGLYARAIAGALTMFTGISAAYEAPASPDIHLRTDRMTPDEAVSRILSALSAP